MPVSPSNPFDPIHALLERQLASWRRDPGLRAGHLYLLSRSHSLDVEVSKVGDSPTLSKEELKSLLTRSFAAQEPGFEVNVSSLRGYGYPLRQDGMLQGVWVLFPTTSQEGEGVRAWARDSLSFSRELFTLRQASLGDPPTFRQLVETIPEDEEHDEPESTPPLHWERSQARVVVAVEDELSACLLVDHLPIF